MDKLEDGALFVRRARQVVDPSLFELILFPTEKCNFRCVYCYEDFAIGRMRSDVVDGVKALIEERAKDIDRLHISWFGGEPLLALPVVRDVSGFANRLLTGSGKTFSGTMTTNGYLLKPDVFQSLLDVGVTNYQITLDGPAEVHDSTRLRADGAGTFAQIWRNLLEIASLTREKTHLEFMITIRIHYSRDSAYRLGPLIKDIVRELDSRRHFRIHFHRIERLGGKNDAALDEASEAEDAYVDALLRDTAHDPDATHTMGTWTDGYVCYAARANSLIVRADGRIGKCTVALEDDRNTIGTIRRDGSLQIDNAKLQPWVRGLFTGDAADLACPLQGMAKSH